jgi:two-component system cell cycle response regulator
MQAEGLVLLRQPVQNTVLSGRILIADDDVDFRRILVRRASQLGLSVVEAEDGQQAIDIVNTENFDIILVDLNMPKHNGIEVVQVAREEDPNLQAIILTGGATIETAIEALRTGVYDYLTKPLETLADLDITLKRALEHRRLIEENERLFAEVQRLAITDPLTGLFNRRKLDELLATEVERAVRYDRPLSIIMIDLDDLKRINDAYGHPQGDEALRLVADAIRSQIRSVDLGTRFGGDEFVILLPEAGLEAARLVGKRICEKITSTPFRGEQLSVSAGVAQWMREYTSSEHFLRAVDQAMYQAKRAGGKRICVLDAQTGRSPDQDHTVSGSRMSSGFKGGGEIEGDG